MFTKEELNVLLDLVIAEELRISMMVDGTDNKDRLVELAHDFNVIISLYDKLDKEIVKP